MEESIVSEERDYSEMMLILIFWCLILLFVISNKESFELDLIENQVEEFHDNELLILIAFFFLVSVEYLTFEQYNLFLKCLTLFKVIYT
jgi:hypothetical protein